MKWKHPKDGQKRIIKKFALFPIRLNGETRWLETVYILQKYLDGNSCGYWDNKMFCSKGFKSLIDERRSLLE